MIKKLVILIGTIMLVGCSFNPTSSNTVSSSFNFNQKYISAKRIYDYKYEYYHKPDIITLDEFPNFVFRSYNDISYSIDGRDDLGKPNSIYIADFNNDGYVDLGYTFELTNSSTIQPSLVRIYDYYHDELIFDFDNQKSSFLDIDKYGNAIIEELAMTKPYGISKVERVGRFLRGNNITFEWDLFDGFKLKSIYLEPSVYGYKNDMIFTYMNTITSLRLSLCGSVSKTLEEIVISINEIKVKRNDEFYSFEVFNKSQANNPFIYINFIFLKVDIIEIEISINHVITKEPILVIPQVNDN